MTEIDHVFVWTDIGAPEADRLIELGMIEGPPNRHEGQGTANRRFFFANAMLELLWVENADEARHHRRLGLWDRWSRRDGGACPFGICLRGEQPPFAAWSYEPPYSPATPIFVADTSITEPFLCFLPMPPRSGDQPMRLVRVRIEGPFGAMSEALRDAIATGAFAVAQAAEWTMELTFDDGARYAIGSRRNGSSSVTRFA